MVTVPFFAVLTLGLSIPVYFVELEKKTTIKVSMRVLAELENLKNKLKLSSLEDVIVTLLRERRRWLVEEAFGIDKGKVSGFTKADRLEDRLD